MRAVSIGTDVDVEPIGTKWSSSRDVAIVDAIPAPATSRRVPFGETNHAPVRAAAQHRHVDATHLDDLTADRVVSTQRSRS